MFELSLFMRQTDWSEMSYNQTEHASLSSNLIFIHQKPNHPSSKKLQINGQALSTLVKGGFGNFNSL